MKKRPWPIIILAILHVLAAPGNLIFNAYIAGIPISQKWHEYMMPQYRLLALFYMLAPVIAGLSIYICKRWSFWVYLVTLLSLCASSYYGYKTHAGAVPLTLLFGVLFLDLVIVLYFFLPAVRAVYFDPRLRWWETHPRYRTDFTAHWQQEDIGSQGEVLNFSVGGLFFKSAAAPADNAPIRVSFEYGGKNYEFVGTAILHSLQNNMGFGMKFQHTPESTRAAAELVKKLGAAGLLIKNRLPGPEDGFWSWLKTLVTTGKGIVPEIKQRK